MSHLTAYDIEPQTESFRRDVLRGLRQPRKELPSKYFYDARGSCLFDQICKLDEYYLTRAEFSIMHRFVGQIAARLGRRCLIAEYGSGSGLKTRYLLDHLIEPAAYVPIDISKNHLVQSAETLAARFPDLEVVPVCADFTGGFNLPSISVAVARTVVYFPGSTIGNFRPPDATRLLAQIVAQCGEGGALLIGVTAAKTLSWIWGKPLVAVDHIEAHAHSPTVGLDRGMAPWPAVGLIVSGGHTSLFRIDGPTAMALLGATTDDAAGEAFDKVAGILGLSYPGGPEIERVARNGDRHAIDFPRTMLAPDSLDFSFSGIKTAVLYHVHGHGKTTGGLEKLSRQDVADIAASFQEAVVDVLVRKTMLAVWRTGLSTIVLGGGVAANSTLRSALETACGERNLSFHAADPAYCTDNAAMIAALGYHLWARGDLAGLDLEAFPTGTAPNR